MGQDVSKSTIKSNKLDKNIIIQADVSSSIFDHQNYLLTINISIKQIGVTLNKYNLSIELLNKLYIRKDYIEYFQTQFLTNNNNSNWPYLLLAKSNNIKMDIKAMKNQQYQYYTFIPKHLLPSYSNNALLKNLYGISFHLNNENADLINTHSIIFQLGVHPSQNSQITPYKITTDKTYILKLYNKSNINRAISTIVPVNNQLKNNATKTYNIDKANQYICQIILNQSYYTINDKIVIYLNFEAQQQVDNNSSNNKDLILNQSKILKPQVVAISLIKKEELKLAYRIVQNEKKFMKMKYGKNIYKQLIIY